MENGLCKGTFQILSLQDGEVVWASPEMNNLILDAFWSNLIQHLKGVATNPFEVTSIEVGTGSAAVSASDTALATMTVSAIPPSKVTPSTKTILIEFFITDAEMANTTYRELGLRSGSTLITRALFTTPYVKASGRDTIIRYTLSFDSE